MIKELANICLIIILLLISISLILLGIMAIIYLIGLIKETLYEIQMDDEERNNNGKRQTTNDSRSLRHKETVKAAC